jgi:peptidoglycan/xylan/chitin deacetylase (PgdA/CDA1 family)
MNRQEALIPSYSERLDERSVAIFLFHGVIRTQTHAVRNYTRKHLTLERFRHILEDLLSHGTPISLPQLVDIWRNQSAPPPRAFVITFDDGFENNFSVAARALETLGIPATFYVTSGFIDDNTPSWTDDIEEAVEKSEAFRSPEEKKEFLNAIRLRVKADRDIDPYQVAKDIRLQLDSPPFVPDPQLDQKMSWSQVAELSQNRLFTVGGHGHTHRILSFLSPVELEGEITLSLARLRSATGGHIAHYSYPEGLSHCYSESVIHALRRHGIICAPTAEDGVNQVGDDLFRLKRIMVT